MPGQDAPPPAAPPDPVQQTIDRIRDTVRWLLTGFAAIGAVLITGLSLSNLRDRDTDVGLASIGFGLAIAGIVGAAIFAGLVLAGERLLTIADVASGKEFAGLRPRIEASPAVSPFLDGQDGLSGLSGKLEQAVRDRATAVSAASAALTKENVALVTFRDEQVKDLNHAIRTALAEAKLFRASRRFRRFGAGMAASILVVALGAFIFVRSLGDPSAPRQAAALLRVPTPVVLVFDDSGRQRLGATLGQDCVTAKVPAVVIEQQGADTMRVAVAKSAKCAATVVSFVLGVDGSFDEPAAKVAGSS